MKTNEFLTELSNEKLAKYKTAAAADASKADKAGDFKKGDKRFKGIVKATNKQFANDTKKVQESKQDILNESLLMEDPIYRQFKSVSKYIVERRLSKQEIYQIFADAETGMTNKDTGANRTMLGRGKDATGKAITSVKDAVSGVLNSIQSSAPVAAVDVAYDQATAALGKLTGGEKGKIMKSIIAYRNLAKQYPKAAGFAKAALVAAVGLATGGAGLPAIAGLTYALDSAIKGDKLSSVIGKGAGAAALAYGGQAAAQYAHGPGGADIPGANPHQLDPSQMQQGPGGGGAGGADIPGANPHQLDPSQMQQGPGGADIPGANPHQLDPSQMQQANGPNIPGANPHQLDPSQMQQANGPNIPGANPHQLDPSQMQQAGGSYTVTQGDQVGRIAKAHGVNVEAIRDANPQIDFSKPIQQGMKLNLPPADGGAGSLWKGYKGMYGDRAPVSETVWKNYTNTLNKTIVESIAFKKLSAYDLIDKKTTAFNWALNESIGNKNRNINLTTVGVYTIFENVDRYRLAVMEAAASPISFDKNNPEHVAAMAATTASEKEKNKRDYPSSTTPAPAAPTSSAPAPAAPTSSAPAPAAPATPKPARAPGSTRPEQYRPDQPGGKGKQSKPGLIGRGLNWLDKTAGKVGGALSNFGHQFTTNVTKEKLKMNWTQKGQPSDSDEVAAFMKSQGVPEDVISTVYTKMGLPYTMTPAAAATSPAANTGSTSANTSGAGAGAFSSMANQLPKSTNTSSTGGTTTNTSTGLTHTSKAVAPTSDGAGGTSSVGGMSQPSQPNSPSQQQAVARTVRQQIDDIMHTIMTQHNDDQPSLVKYLRQRLDSSFPGDATTVAAPKRAAPKKAAPKTAAPKGKKPDNTVAMPKPGKMNQKRTATAESVGLPYPGTYEQTNDKFKSKGQRRVAALTNEEEKQRLDPHCWDNKKIGNPKTKMKGGVRVNNCVPIKESAILQGLRG